MAEILDFNKAVVKATTKPSATPLSTIKPQMVEWLWEPRIPAGHLTLLVARGGSGKGLVATSIAAAVTTGTALPDGEETEQGSVLWGECEDPLDQVVVPRLMAAKADRDYVTAINPDWLHETNLRAYIKEHNVRLIVLSPLVGFLEGLDDINGELGVREALGKLLDAVAGTECAVLGICHTNKKADLAAAERVLGSVAFYNLVRSVLIIATNTSKDEVGKYRLVHAKHNLSVRADDLLFTPMHVGKNPLLHTVAVEWAPSSEQVEVDTFLDKAKEAKAKPKKQSAADWLFDYLYQHGPTLKQEVLKAGAMAGHKGGALSNAMSSSTTMQSALSGVPPQATWSVGKS